MNDFYPLLKEDMTSIDRIDKSRNVDIRIEVMPNSVTDYVEATAVKDKSEYSIIMTGRGEFMCTCLDNQFKGKVCKHLIATLKKLDDELRDRYVDKMARKKRFDEI